MIRLDEVTKVYPGGLRAVDGVSLTVGAGECLVLVGPSGCGKTTTLKLINLLLAPTSGRISVNGRDTAASDAIALRRSIGYVIQEVGLLPHMTVLENVGVVPRLLGWPRSRILDRARGLLDLVGLPPAEFEWKHPYQLSGGQRQRVGVARALAADPPLILMDEPFGALDPITRAQLQDEFLRLRGRLRKTIVFVTHDIDEAVRLGDRIAVMREGRIVQLAAPAEILRHPADAFVREFVGQDRVVKLLKLARVRELADRRAAQVAEECGAEEARRLMQDRGADTLLVTGRDGALRGVLGFQDLGAGEGRVGDRRMRPHPTIGEDLSLHDAMASMITEGTAWLAVVDAEGRLFGVLTMSALSRLLVSGAGAAGDGERRLEAR